MPGGFESLKSLCPYRRKPFGPLSLSACGRRLIPALTANHRATAEAGKSSKRLTPVLLNLGRVDSRPQSLSDDWTRAVLAANLNSTPLPAVRFLSASNERSAAQLAERRIA